MQEKLIYSKVKTNNGTMGYVKFGSGPPLIMITRYAATLFNWDSDLVLGLSKKFTLYLFDLRLVGSSQTQNDEDILGCINDVYEAVSKLDLKQYIILGWSFGGVIAQHYYRAFADKIVGMVLLSSFPNPQLASSEFINLSMGTNSDLSDEDKLKLYYLMVSELPNPEIPNWLKTNTLNIESYDYRYTIEAKILHNKFVHSSIASTSEDLRAIKVPCLILNAKNDVSFPASGREMFIKNIPESKMIIYPSGGHLLIHHHGAEIAMDITNYFYD